MVRRIDVRYAPKRDSWLNIVENELSTPTRQGPSGRRIGDGETLRAETASKPEDVNVRRRGLDWPR